MSRWGSRRNQKSNRLVVETYDDEDYDPNRSVSYDVSSTGASTGYVPPTRFGAPLGLHSAEDGQVYAEEEEYYVSGPPRHRTLTGNISSLFRRSLSRERQPATAAMSSPGSSSRRRNSTEDPTTPSAALAHMPHRSPRTSTATTSTKKHKSKRRSSSRRRKGGDPVPSKSAPNSPRRVVQAPPPVVDAASFAAAAAAATAIAMKRSPSQQSHNSRLFYSSHGDAADDDSDEDDDSDQDSYESRATSKSMGTYTRETTTTTTYESSAGATSTIGTILRYRGFSTSIQNLFLDEALVCASMGCFGLLLSNRTEYLLQLRNDRRGVRWGRSTSRQTLPSRIVAYALLLTFLLVSSTFVIWGFGSGDSSSGFAQGFYDGYEANQFANGDDYHDDQYSAYSSSYQNQNQGDDAAAGDDQQQQDDQVQGDNNYNGDDGGNYNYNYNNGNNYNNNGGYNYNQNNGGRRMVEPSSKKCPRPTHGIFKIREVHEGVWEPALNFFQHEWYRTDMDTATLPHTDPRSLAQNGKNGGNSYYSSYNNDDYRYAQQQAHDSSRDLAADLRLSFFIAFLIVLGVLGRRRRMRTRYYLVRARAQEDHLFYASSGAGVKRVAFQDSREDQYEGACSHTLCGCYPIDPPMDGDEIDDDVKVDDDGVTQRKKIPYHHDCVSSCFSCLMGCCCGFMCRCWFQCMSICALAQEAREIRLLVPTRYQRVDYITHQPFHEYQKNVNDLRRGWMGKSRKKAGIRIHFSALSRLSRYILAWFLVCFIVITATLCINPKASFSWPDIVILVATFLQSFFVLYLIHWIFHKSDLSLDAVIKFFAAGFLIAVPAAFFFEGMLVNLTLTLAYMGYAIGGLISGSFNVWVVDNYKWLWVFGEIFNAYIVAAITEELCKYYTFRCVEHPDLIFLTGLARSSQDQRAVQGGIVKYPFGSHQLENTNRDGFYDDDDDRSVSSRASHRSTRGRANSSGAVELNPDNTEEEFEEDDKDVRSYRQKAAAVTTAMISVAVGLACAENFLYVFLLGGAEGNSGEDHSGGVVEEWIVLLFRSLFPVHALAAAMQSISVVRKYVECDSDSTNRIGVGRIIFPAVVMHGSFDAVLLAINVYIETSWDAYLEKNEGNFDPKHPPYNPLLVNLVAWCSIVMIMMAGLFWYYRQNRQQRSRLIVLEEKDKAALDSNMAYHNPDAKTLAPHVSEVELV